MMRVTASVHKKQSRTFPMRWVEIHMPLNRDKREWDGRGMPRPYLFLLLLLFPNFLFAQAKTAQVVVVTCESKPGERNACPADTSKGVILAKSMGEAPCLLGKTWGYDDKSVWVSDGCSGQFVVKGEGTQEPSKKPEYIPNAGFRLYTGDKGEIYMRLFSYARYLNQKGLDPTYTDSFGNTFSVKQREDFQLTKFFLPFS